MFRRHKSDEVAADASKGEEELSSQANAASPAGGVPVPTLELDRAFDQRAIAHGDAIMALRGRGVQDKARVTSLTLLYECRPDPDFAGFEELVPNSPREWSATGVVAAGTADEFEASFLIYPGLGDPDPQEGGEVRVFYDPADRTRLYGEIIVKVAPTIRWKVPAHCPECGAPVDQSSEALAEHPLCHSCRNPLPCEPA
jgi:hypothetical protein